MKNSVTIINESVKANTVMGEVSITKELIDKVTEFNDAIDFPQWKKDRDNNNEN